MRCSGEPNGGFESIPKTPPMITSSVTACIRGASANGLPVGHVSISRSATSEMSWT